MPTTNDGRTSEFAGVVPAMSPPTHTAELMEIHEVSVPIPAHLIDAALGRNNAGACVTSRSKVEFARAAAWSACQREAQAWLAASGVEAEVDVFTAGGGREGEPRWGARWTVMVGRGASTQTFTTTTPEHDVPAVDNWTWSDRWYDWLNRFRAMAAEHRMQVTGTLSRDGLADVIELHAGGRR